MTIHRVMEELSLSLQGECPKLMDKVVADQFRWVCTNHPAMFILHLNECIAEHESGTFQVLVCASTGYPLLIRCTLQHSLQSVPTTQDGLRHPAELSLTNARMPSQAEEQRLFFIPCKKSEINTHFDIGIFPDPYTGGWEASLVPRHKQFASKSSLPIVEKIAAHADFCVVVDWWFIKNYYIRFHCNY